MQLETKIGLEIYLHITMKTIKNNWTPDPNNAVNNRVCRGGRKTSPCTNFHPDSSKISSYKVGKSDEY